MVKKKFCCRLAGVLAALTLSTSAQALVRNYYLAFTNVPSNVVKATVRMLPNSADQPPVSFQVTPGQTTRTHASVQNGFELRVRCYGRSGGRIGPADGSWVVVPYDNLKYFYINLGNLCAVRPGG